MAVKDVREYTCDRCGKKLYMDIKYIDMGCDSIIGGKRATAVRPVSFRSIGDMDLCDHCYRKFQEFMGAMGKYEEEEDAVEENS